MIRFPACCSTFHPPSRGPGRLRRAGYTLIEMLVVITIISTVFTSTAVALSLMNRLHEQLRSEIPASDLLGRLTTALRRDAHHAVEWTLVGPQAGGEPADVPRDEPSSTTAGVRLTFRDSSSVVYEQRQEGIVRQLFRDGTRAGLEIFRFPGARSIRWEIAGPTPHVLHLYIDPPPARTSRAPQALRQVHVAAGLGVYESGQGEGGRGDEVAR